MASHDINVQIRYDMFTSLESVHWLRICYWHYTYDGWISIEVLRHKIEYP